MMGVYEHAATVRRFLHGRLANPCAVDDAIQETFARALKRRDTLREEDKLVPWLLGIARMVSWEHHRRAKRWVLLPELPETVTDAHEGPEAELFQQETTAALERGLATLSDPRREALLLRVNADLGYAEIGDAMGWSPAKVKNELHRARRQLKAVLGAALCVLAFGAWPKPTPSAQLYASLDAVWCADIAPPIAECIEPPAAMCEERTPICE